MVAQPQRKRAIKGTNIVVQTLEPSSSAHASFEDRSIAMLNSIDRDDATEVQWLRTLRPERSLIHPAEAFLQGIKKLRPALDFNTFDMKKSKARRATRRTQEQAKALKRREERLVPTSAMRAINSKRGTRSGGHATSDEVRLLSRGKENQRALAHIAAFQAKKKTRTKRAAEGDDVKGSSDPTEGKKRKPSQHGRDRKRRKREKIGQGI